MSRPLPIKVHFVSLCLKRLSTVGPSPKKTPGTSFVGRVCARNGGEEVEMSLN